ncbi:MAG: hypothetical protein RLY97_1515 [Pseudomonadota bacterium]
MGSNPKPARADRFGTNGWLRDWVTRPMVALSVQELPLHWRICEMSFVCAKPAGFQAGDWMVRSVRGALGRILAEMRNSDASKAMPASAFEGLFQTHGMVDGVHIPKPIRLVVAVEGERIRIVIRLFGQADIWRDCVVEAMAEALRRGIGLWENGAILREWPMVDWYWQSRASMAIPDWSGDAILRFTTPFKPGSAEVFSGDFVTNLPSLVKRVKGMARWIGADLQMETGGGETEGVNRAQMQILPPGYGLGGFVKRGRGQGSAVVGMLGAVELRHISAELWPILWLGASVGAGGHAIYGFGGYEVTAV